MGWMELNLFFGFFETEKNSEFYYAVFIRESKFF